MSLYIDNNIRIEKLDEGFLFFHADKKFAVANLEGLFKQIRKAYKLTDRIHGKVADNNESMEKVDDHMDETIAKANLIIVANPDPFPLPLEPKKPPCKVLKEVDEIKKV